MRNNMHRHTPNSGREVAVLSLAALLMWLCAPAMAQNDSVVNSPHNLSAAGPGSIRASGEQQVCIFCHAPHNASPIQPLWNRHVPVNPYTVYSSNSLQAAPGQPTGSSKLCLSCHDGTIALGSVVSRGQSISMAGGITTLPPGTSNLGTDLSDDHPVSFRYDAELVAKDPKLKNPAQLPNNVKLDSRQEMQCTTCHDAHSNRFGDFLVMDNNNSQLCNSCHERGTTDVAGHLQCASCHQPHTAPSGSHLLKASTVSQTCLTCHSGQPGFNQGENVAADLVKLSRHDTNSPVNQANHEPNNVGCSDCHEGHTMRAQTAVAPAISPKLGAVRGVDAAGVAVAQAQYQYEVCFKCHATQTAVQPQITRQIVQNNSALEFAPSAVSFHPVEAAGKNPNVPSLSPGLTTASIIYCTDCHASETSTAAGGSGPNGPHGSSNRPLLLARYETMDNTAESASAYALCYRCHERSSILGDQSFPLHSRHIVNAQTPCSVCHDAHGVSSAQGTNSANAHLINFDTSVVDPGAGGELRYDSVSRSCTLTCHGVVHSPATHSYP